jgi:GNAT superfamily N-acetyltransferase
MTPQAIGKTGGMTTAPGTRRWTLPEALARAAEVVRTEGARALVARAAGETLYRRLVLVERDLAEPLDADVPVELAFGYLDGSAVDAYEAFRPGGGRRAEQRLADGDRCFATWSGGRLVAVRWLATGAPRIEYLDLPLQLVDGEIYHYDTFTDPSLRRRGISVASQARLFETLRREGFRCSIRALLPENRAALRDAARAGYRERGRIGYVKLGPWRRPFRTDRRTVNPASATRPS